MQCRSSLCSCALLLQCETGLLYTTNTTLFIIFISISFVRIAIQYSCWLIRCCYMLLLWYYSDGCYGLVLFEKGLQRVKTYMFFELTMTIILVLYIHDNFFTGLVYIKLSSHWNKNYVFGCFGKSLLLIVRAWANSSLNQLCVCVSILGYRLSNKWHYWRLNDLFSSTCSSEGH